MFRFLMIPFLVIGLTIGSLADGFISYKVPFVPLEFIFDEDGIHWEASKTIVTPLGSFSLGYANNDAKKLDKSYTYVIIQDLNTKKEYPYKINDKKKLTLLSEGRTEITITKNIVLIVVEKGSQFMVKFSVDGEDDAVENSTSKWFSPTDKEVDWEKANRICKDNGGRLPTREELRKVVTDCGGTIDDYANNKANSSYQSCYKNKGFTSHHYWSSATSVSVSFVAWFVFFYDGDDYWGVKTYEYRVRCVRGGQ
jgi:hypothetical protein